jgi:predicted MFS family arabinose efflux permease
MDDETRHGTMSDVDWALLGPLLAHVVITHLVVGVVRVTVSYRTIELGLPVVWLGVISAGFAALPIVIAVPIGRFIDRGYDAHAVWLGSALVLLACAALWAAPISGAYLLAFTILLGAGHMFLMASQQLLVVRSATGPGRDVAFGHFMVAISLGQGLGPFIVGVMGGGATVPATEPLFAGGVLTAIVCFLISLAIRPAPRVKHVGTAAAVPVIALLRRPGMLAVMTASVVTVTASDLLLIYLPLLGAERGIDARDVGNLLLVRSIAALVARLFYGRLIYAVGRMPLTLGSTFLGALAFGIIAVPSLPVMYAASVAIGVGLGIAATLTLSGIVEVAPPEARGTAMTLRITGNRVGLLVMPFAAGLVATVTGVAGILVLIGASLAGCGLGLKLSGNEGDSLEG